MEDLSAVEASAARIGELQLAIDGAIRERNKLIVEARNDGYPWERLSNAARLSRQGTEQAARRGNGGLLPRPRQRG